MNQQCRCGLTVLVMMIMMAAVGAGASSLRTRSEEVSMAHTEAAIKRSGKAMKAHKSARAHGSGIKGDTTDDSEEADDDDDEDEDTQTDSVNFHAKDKKGAASNKELTEAKADHTEAKNEL